MHRGPYAVSIYLFTGQRCDEHLLWVGTQGSPKHVPALMELRAVWAGAEREREPHGQGACSALQLL